MNIGKYNIDVTEFQWRPWSRVEVEYEKNNEDKGHAYIFRGWLCFVITHTESFGWKDFQKNIKKTVDENYDNKKIYKL